MFKPQFLSASQDQLIKIAQSTHNTQILPIAISLWRRHLNPENPLWNYVKAHPFSVDSSQGSAHALGLIDSRLPNIGLLGYFACSDRTTGAQVLTQATEWFSKAYNIHTVYGPINGTITSDYRLNLQPDYYFPSEPVNPLVHIEAFQDAGFNVFNKYTSAITKQYRSIDKFLSKKLAQEYEHILLRPFDITNQLSDLNLYHNLMNRIFPPLSIYCPIISWEEREYNLATKDPIFDPKYTYFIESMFGVIGFVVAFSYNNHLILKTIGILPEHRKKGLFELLVKKVHDQANQDKLEAAIYATIRVGNVISKIKIPGVINFRDYVTMHKNS
jgi:hypothetical protein